MAEQHALGLGHEAIAGTDQDVGRMAGEEAVGHGGDALDAAEVEDVVGATEVHRIEDARMDAAMLRRRHRAGDDVADASHLGGGDRSEEHTSELQSLMRKSY